MSNIVVPELGESVVEARIARWLKKAGDQVEVGEPLVELETEKTNLELSAEKRGVITSIARKEGEDVKIGELLAVVDENGAGAQPPPRPETAPARKAEPTTESKPSHRQAKQARTDAAESQGRTDQRGAIAPTAASRTDQRSKLAPTTRSQDRTDTRQADRTDQDPAIAPKNACA